MGNAPPKLTPQEQLKKYQKELKKAIRSLEREERTMSRNQEKIARDIRKAAKEGQSTVMRTHAKSYARTKKYSEKFLKMKTQLQSVSLQMTAMSSTHAMTEAMRNTTKVMVRMGKSMKAPQIAKIAREFAMQSEVMEQTSEIVGEAVDDALASSDEEEEAESLVNQVLAELRLSSTGEVIVPTSTGVAAPTAAAVAAPIGEGAGGPPRPPGGGGGCGGGGEGGVPAAAPSASVSELEERLRNLRG